MTVRIPNFRGHRALVLHPGDANRQTLVDQLRRFGIDVLVAWPTPELPPDGVDVVFFDADRGPGAGEEGRWPSPGPAMIAISGTEAPGRLEAMLAVGPSAMLNKPIRREGIFKALVFAYHNAERRRQLEESLAVAREQVKARHVVLKAILLVMERLGIDDDEAFAAVRRASMSSNMLIEAFATGLLNEPHRTVKLVARELSRVAAEGAEGRTREAGNS